MKNRSHRSNLVSLDEVRDSMTRLWFIGAGLVFLILVVQTALGKYNSEDAQKVWSWFVPTTIPTLAPMVGVLGGDASHSFGRRFCKKGFKILTFWLSFTYLVVLAATILLQPFSGMDGTRLFQISNYYLTPIQGLVVTAIGFIFTSNKSRERDSNSDGKVDEPASSG